MSHSEMINYEALALQCKAICGIAKTGLDQIEEILSKIKATSASLQTKKIKDYEIDLLKEKDSIKSQIEHLYQVADNQAKKSGMGRNSDARGFRNDVINAAKALQFQANNLLGSRIEVLNQMVNEELINMTQRTNQEIKNSVLGIIQVNEDLLHSIESIEDIALRESVYREAIKSDNGNLSFDELVALGNIKLKELTHDLLTKHKERILAGIRKDMEAARIDQATIEKTMTSNSNIQEIRSAATNEIIGEEVRKESLKIILKAIEARGFIVDRKNSIKIDRDKNEVIVLGKKASGQTAEFKIYLDGRFSYKFDGFEGQACQKDIEPFMEDLEEIYGMKITGRLDLWKNPDKLSSRKHQALGTNKGKK